MERTVDALGKRLVKALLNEKSIAPVQEAGIVDSDIFADGLIAYKWATTFFSEKGEWPSSRMLEESTGITLPTEADPLHYVANLVRKRSLSWSLEADLKRSAEFIESRDPDSALTILCESALKHRDKRTKARPVSFRDSGKARLDSYEEVKLLGGMRGIRSPWVTMNLAVQGWVDGTLNVVAALQNTGKSFFSLIIAENCMSLGKKVLYITLEMPTDRITRRLDAIRYKIPFHELRDVSMPPDVEAKLKELISKEMKETGGDILIADKQAVQTVADVLPFVLEYSPDVVVIDGGYRFQGSRGKGEWENTKSIVAELQLAAEVTNKPWIVTTQQGDSNETGKEIKRGPKMRAWNIRYGKEWVINPDNVIGLYQDHDLRLVNQMEVHFLKTRDPHPDSPKLFNINWDMKRMIFTEFGGGFFTVPDSSHEVEF